MTVTLAGKDLSVDAEGYLQEPEQWDRTGAGESAEEVCSTQHDAEQRRVSDTER